MSEKKWLSKRMILNDLRQISGPTRLDPITSVRDKPPAVQKENTEFEKKFGNVKYVPFNDKGPELDLIGKMIEMVNDYTEQETPSVEKDDSEGLLQITKLNPNVPEFIPKEALLNKSYETKKDDNKNSSQTCANMDVSVKATNIPEFVPKQALLNRSGETKKEYNRNSSQTCANMDVSVKATNIPEFVPKQALLNRSGETKKDDNRNSSQTCANMDVSVKATNIPEFVPKQALLNRSYETKKDDNKNSSQTCANMDVSVKATNIPELVPKQALLNRSYETKMDDNKNSSQTCANMNVSVKATNIPELVPKQALLNRSDETKKDGNKYSSQTYANMNVSVKATNIPEFLPKHLSFNASSDIKEDINTQVKNDLTSINDSYRKCENMDVCVKMPDIPEPIPKWMSFNSSNEKINNKNIKVNNNLNANKISDPKCEYMDVYSHELVPTLVSLNASNEAKKGENTKTSRNNSIKSDLNCETMGISVDESINYLKLKIKNGIESEPPVRGKILRNAAMMSLLKLQSKKISQQPLKLLTPQHFVENSCKKKINDVNSTNDSGKEADFCLPKPPLQSELSPKKENCPVKIIEEKDSGKDASEQTDTISQHEMNISIEKVDNWLAETTTPTKKAVPPSLHIGPITYKRKITKTKKVDSNMSKSSTRSSSPQVSKVYVPSELAEELYKEYKEKSENHSTTKNDIWSRVQKELEDRDKRIRGRKLASAAKRDAEDTKDQASRSQGDGADAEDKAATSQEDGADTVNESK